MKTVAYTALHYGTDYLHSAITSVIQDVDRYVVLYSAQGSHGHRTNEPCPDSRADLLSIAQNAAGDKLQWYDGTWPHEGAQRDTIYSVAPDADIVLALDADEIWPDGLATHVMHYAIDHDIHNLRVPIIHYWRSFYRCVLHDPAFPVRVINRRGQHERALPNTGRVINHMGYAQRPEIIQYKLLTHGHRNEFRRDCDWFTDIFMANRQTDCHVVGSEFWNPEPVNPLDYMPDFMRNHPYFDKELI